MYNLPHFKEPDPQVLLQFMQQHPFALITGCNAGNEPVATQVPVFIDERDGNLFITGHIIRNADHYKAFEQNKNVLAVFTGPHAYISASWYEHQQSASTWNYMSVYARGTIRYTSDEELKHLLQRLTNHFENDPNSPSNYEQLPEEYVNGFLKAITGFEIAVTQLDHVFKLSQNRDEKSYDNIIHQLAKQEGDARIIAAIMKERKSKVFPQ